MIKAVQRTEQIFVVRNRGIPYLVDPEYGSFAVVLPPLDGIDVGNIPYVLADDNEQIVFLSNPNLSEAGVHEHKSSRHIVVQTFSLPSRLQLKS